MAVVQFSHRIAAKVLDRAAVSEDLTQARGSSSSSFTWILAGGFSTLAHRSLHRAFHDVTSPRVNDLRKGENFQDERFGVLLNLHLKVTSLLPYYSVHTDQPWYNVGGDYTSLWVSCLEPC